MFNDSRSRSESSASILSSILRNKWFRIAAGLILLWIFGPVEWTPSGSKALRFTMGALEEGELSEGVNYKIPIIQQLKTISIRPQEIIVTVEVGPSAAITKDNQSIGATITIFYKYQQGQLVKLWRDIGIEQMENIITKTALEDYKKSIGNHTIFDIAADQEKIRNYVAEKIRANLGGYPVEVTEVKITNYDWSESFEKQIEETMHRAQQVKQKQQELLITEQEAQKKVKEAEADKTAMITRAEGEKGAAQLKADAKALEGEGIRKYNQSVATNWEIELKKMQLEIERIKAQKWNGQYVPTNNYGPIPVQTGGMQPDKQ